MKQKLLIVDDSSVIRNHISRLMIDPRLSNLTIVGVASDGEKALVAAKAFRPDVITMDLTMPNMDGEACIEQISQFLPDARILVISALSDKATAIRALTKGAHGFLQKPFSDESLVESLVEILS
ncbi:MAG: response regulator [Rhodocyclaceae bacterium]|nr:response regulator [Rhodocyclaceae bacterium]